MSVPRRWARRAALSALAGGGLTALGLGGQLPPPLDATLSYDGPERASAAEGEGSTSTVTQTANGSSEGSSSTTSTTQTSAGSESSTQSSSSSPTTSSSSTQTGSTETGSTQTGSSSTQTGSRSTQTSSTQTSSTSGGRRRGSHRSPAVLGEHGQHGSGGSRPSTGGTRSGGRKGGAGASSPGGPSSPSEAEGNVAPPPQMVASQAEALASLLGAPAVSLQALDFYRIPMFLLPIYQAAAVQYGVPWQVLAAINEVETDYGTDLNVSSAGAIGWMQFMPETWLRYGVDVQEAGYADPYNPIDAIFAAARYLRAAGASHDLKTAVFAYNHSQAYVESVLLRAKLIAHYPTAVIATLTGLAEGRLPVAHALATAETMLTPGASTPTIDSVRAAKARATKRRSNAATSSSTAAPAVGGEVPGSVPAPTPAASAASVTGLTAAPQRFGELVGRSGAPVIAVQDGKIVGLGRSRKLGRYVILRDVYGDVFTYSGLGSIAPTYSPPRLIGSGEVAGIVAAGAQAGKDEAPVEAASAGSQASGSQAPLTLHVKAPARKGAEPGPAEAEPEASEGLGKVRVFAHPGSSYSKAAIARARAEGSLLGERRRLRVGSVVSQGTVLGQAAPGPGHGQAHLRFAISPAGDAGTVPVQPVLQSWRQLGAALHPRGARRDAGLIGATAGDAFLLQRAALQRAVLSDPGIGLPACAKRDVAGGVIDTRALATLVFLSRSGLKPAIGPLPCARAVKGGVSVPGSPVQPPLHTLQVVKVNGVKIAGHEGAGSITDLTIRTLLTLQGRFAPAEIESLMRYPGSPITVASGAHWRTIKIAFAARAATGGASASPGGATAVAPGAAARAANATAATSATAASSLLLGGGLRADQWSALMGRIGAIPQPQITRKPSSSAIADHPARKRG